jgi:uncharacterized protein (DUF2249 family)
MENKKIIELDVRPILATGTDPFELIMDNIKELNAETETLKIINSFEPIPLINKLEKDDFVCKTERLIEGEVHVYISKSETSIIQNNIQNNTNTSFEELEKRFIENMETIDVREYEMPMPMVLILEKIEQLPEGKALFVHHKKLPQYLLPELENRSYLVASKPIDDSNVKLIIYKK